MCVENSIDSRFYSLRNKKNALEEGSLLHKCTGGGIKRGSNSYQNDVIYMKNVIKKLILYFYLFRQQ